ncbi:MAG: hypothetical protein GY796_18805 [Chloroflexi bacterium]|nr:hypothetical protein [Chloroflexota bacterium]
MDQIKQLVRRVDPGFLLIFVIGLIAVWPFISRASLPVETDAELHVFRLHELGLLIRGGEIFPRWAPNFYHGYGYPIFNYYAPLSYYVGLLFELLPWFDAVAAVKAVFVIGLLAGGLGMYGFVRDNWGRTAGYVAATVFLYAPYVQYIDPHARGVLAESLSLGVFPLALWALDRLRKGGGALVWVSAVALTAAVILSHNLMALLFFGMLTGWAMWQLIISKWRPSSLYPRGRLLLLFVALGMGLGAAAFFWLPVYLEREAVNLTTLIGQGDNYDFHTHFLTLREMLAFSKWLDWGATEPLFRFNLGVAQWVLGGLGVLMLLARRVKAAAHLVYFALALLLLVLMMLPVSTPIWEVLPFLPFFQFPWRLLGPAAVMLAVLAGAGVSGLLDMRLRGQTMPGWVTAVFVIIPILLSFPMSQPAPWGDFGEVNTLRMSLIENTGRWLGTTSTSDYIPATVDVLPARKGSVVAPVADGKPMDRVNYANLPEGAIIETEVVRPLLTRYILDTPRDTRLRLFLFDFPGWTARIDGEMVETELGRPEGFLVIPVPAGKHLIEVEFGRSPARTMAGWITAVSLFLTLIIAVLLRKGRWQLVDNSLLPPRFPSPFLRVDWIVLGSVLVVTAVFIFILEPTSVLHNNSTGFIAEPAQTDVFADFGEQIGLIGYSVPRQMAVPGDIIPVELYWKAQNEMDINFQAFLHLLQPDGVLVTQSHKLNPGDFPTKRWLLDKYVRDVHYLGLPVDLPPGEYIVSTGLWVQSEGWRLPLLANGTQVGDSFELFRLIVEEP